MQDQNLKIAIDSESVNIYRENAEDQEPTHFVYWHEDEWLENPKLVVPAMLKAIDLYHRDQKQLLNLLGFQDYII